MQKKFPHVKKMTSVLRVVKSFGRISVVAFNFFWDEVFFLTILGVVVGSLWPCFHALALARFAGISTSTNTVPAVAIMVSVSLRFQAG